MTKMDRSSQQTSDTAKVIEVVVLCLIIVAAVVGNISIWIIIISTKALRTVTNMFILVLCAADLLVSVASMPMTVYAVVNGSWPLSDAACVIFGYMNMLTLVTSVLSLCNISIHRFFMVYKPATFKDLYTKRNVIIMILGVVSLSALLSSPPLFGWGEYAYIPIQSFCFCDWANHMWYAFFMIGCCFGGPFGVMTVCNIFIYRRVRASRRAVSKRVPEPSPEVNGTCNEKDKSKDKRNSSDDFESLENDVQLENNSDTVTRHINEDKDEDLKDELEHSRCSTYIYKVKTRKNSTNYGVEAGADLKPSDSSNLPCEHDNNANRIPNNTSSIKALGKSKRRRIEENRFTITLIVVIIVFVICWLPYCISMLLSIFCKDQVPRAFHMFTLIFGYANSCFNPIIYGLMNKRFAEGFKNLYCCFKKPTLRLPVHSLS